MRLLLTEEQQDKAKEMLRTEVKAYFDVRDELGLSKEEYYELIKLDVHEWRIRARGAKNSTPSKAIEEIDRRLIEENGDINFHEVSRELRVLPSTIVGRYRRQGREIDKEPLNRSNNFYRSVDIDKRVCELFDLGLYPSQIIVEMGYRFRTEKSISDILKDYGRALKDLKSEENHINSHVFDFIDTEEKAYWLGMLITDGWVHIKKPKEDTHGVVYQVGLSLQEKDLKVMEGFKEFIGTQRKLLTKTNTLQSGEERKYWSIVIDSKNLFNALNRLGVVEGKTYKTEPQLHLIPKELHRHFWRGCYDGDGSLYFGSANNLTVSYVGGLDIVYKFIAHLYHNQVINHFRAPYLVDKTSDIEKGINATMDIYNPKYAEKNDVYSILQHLYGGATIYMERKYKFWDDLNKERGKDKC